MRVGDYCNRDVVVINSEDSVKDAAEVMRSYHVGDLVILEQQQDNTQVPIGIITDRDLVVEVIAKDINPKSISVRDILTEPFSCIKIDNTLFDALDLMYSKKIRRLPVVNHDKTLVGIITLDDLIDILSETLVKVVDVVKLQQKKEEKNRR